MLTCPTVLFTNKTMPSGIYKRQKTDPFVRFTEKISISKNGCWEWISSRSPQGYGQFWDGNGYCLAHRFSYEHHVGKIPNGLVIDHLCRNPCCVNPQHLECVTMSVNTLRGTIGDVTRLRHQHQTHCLRGHALAGGNLRIDGRGHRMCKKCQKDKAKIWCAKNRDRVNELQRRRRNAK